MWTRKKDMRGRECEKRVGELVEGLVGQLCAVEEILLKVNGVVTSTVWYFRCDEIRGWKVGQDQIQKSHETRPNSSSETIRLCSLQTWNWDFSWTKNPVRWNGGRFPYVRVRQHTLCSLVPYSLCLHQHLQEPLQIRHADFYNVEHKELHGVCVRTVQGSGQPIYL